MNVAAAARVVRSAKDDRKKGEKGLLEGDE